MKDINDFINESINNHGRRQRFNEDAEADVSEMTIQDLLDLLEAVGVDLNFPKTQNLLKRANLDDVLVESDLDLTDLFETILKNPRNKKMNPDVTSILQDFIDLTDVEMCIDDLQSVMHGNY